MTRFYSGAFCVSRGHKALDPINILVEGEMEPMTASHGAAATEPLLSYKLKETDYSDTEVVPKTHPLQPVSSPGPSANTALCLGAAQKFT